MQGNLEDDEIGRTTAGDTSPTKFEERHNLSVVCSLQRLCVEAVATHFGRHSRELLNLSLPARQLLLAHLKTRFGPARRLRSVGDSSGLPESAIDWFVLPDAQSLDLSRCAALSSRTLTAVADRCFQLRTLDLSHATALTDADLRPLFPASFPFITSTSSAAVSFLPSFSSLPFSASASPSSSISPASSTGNSLVLPSTPAANSYSFASSSAPPQSPTPQGSSPGFWNRLFSRHSSSSPSSSTTVTSTSGTLTPTGTLSPSTSSTSLSSLPAVMALDDGGTIMALRSINLRNCSNLTSASVENILRLWGSGLQSLTLDGDRINPASVAALSGASHLTRLALLHSPYLRPIPVSEMKTMDKPEESKYPVFEWQLMPALQGCLGPAMTELILHFDSETITEEVVCQIVGLCGPKLQVLEMPLPSPEAWKLVVRHCTSLRKLDLYGCNCTDDAISGMAHMPNVVEVTVRGCSLSDESFIRIAASCPKTSKVELRSVDSITDAGIEAIAKSATVGLRDLTLASLEQVTDDGVRHFTEWCPNIRMLQLSGMSMDDTSQKLTGSTMAFPKLKELRLSSLYCPDQTVAAILAQCTQLRVLCLDEVGGVTGEGIKSDSLWLLQLRSTPQLTDAGVECLTKQCPNLRAVRVKHQATMLRSLLRLLDAPHLLELRVGEGNLLDDACFGSLSSLASSSIDPPAEHVTDGSRLAAKAAAIEALDNADASGEKADKKANEDRRREDEMASKGYEDRREPTTAAISREDRREETTGEPEPEMTGRSVDDSISISDEGQVDDKAEIVAAFKAEVLKEGHQKEKEDDRRRDETKQETKEEDVCSLRDFRIKNCPLVTDQGVGVLMRRCRWMTHLRLSYFPQITGSTLGGAHLRSVVLDQCGLTNDGFIALIKASPRLQELEISGAGGVGTGLPRERRTIRTIAQLVQFTKLGDEGLRELASHCPHLRSLSLSYLQDVALRDVVIPRLESLVIEDMPAITDETLGAFVGRNTKLCRLDVRAGAVRLEKGTRGSRDLTTATNQMVTTVMSVTAPFVEALKTARPNLAVTYRLVD